MLISGILQQSEPVLERSLVVTISKQNKNKAASRAQYIMRKTMRPKAIDACRHRAVGHTRIRFLMRQAEAIALNKKTQIQRLQGNQITTKLQHVRL